jgi:hypothetical protein
MDDAKLCNPLSKRCDLLRAQSPAMFGQSVLIVEFPDVVLTAMLELKVYLSEGSSHMASIVAPVALAL